MTITIQDAQKGASVQFPFALKDSFRAAFPIATWKPEAKSWEVGSRSVTRLRDWAAEVETSGALEALAQAEECKLAGRELDALRRALEALRADAVREAGALGAAEALRLQAQGVTAQLAAERDRLVALGEARAAADAAAQAAERDVLAEVAGVVDLARLQGALHSLRGISGGTARGRAQHAAATQVVREVLAALAPPGITSDGLLAVRRHNYNRFERDGRPWSEPYHFRVMTAEEGEAAAR